MSGVRPATTRAHPATVRAQQWWAGLSQGQRAWLIAGAVAEAALKTAMLIDLRRRPASQVRGPKWLWASSALVNSAGLIPASYFLVGRR